VLKAPSATMALILGWCQAFTLRENRGERV
jgi:hypothetical protein